MRTANDVQRQPIGGTFDALILVVGTVLASAGLRKRER
jgi:hypothetical protein